MEEFSAMPLKKELVDSLKNIGFLSPTDVQTEAIPVILSGKDAAVRAKTGTGKTGAFAIPIIQKLLENPKPMSTIVLVPTRELAQQVSDVFKSIGRPLKISTVTVYGGAGINPQIDAIRRMPDIVVGTPGRVIDLIKRGILDLSKIRFFVLDEADMMFDMGFIEDIEYILNKTPASKQMMLFSATLPKPIMSIAQRFMKPDKQLITVGKEEEITASGITHLYTVVSSHEKIPTLLAYINQYKPTKCIIFTMTKFGAEDLYNSLKGEGLNVIHMHGGMTQSRRESSLEKFKGNAQFMISTNVAARGLDISDVSDIINFDAPDDPHIYVHRVGRSARMHKEGRAFTIFSTSQRRLIGEIEDTANIRMQEIKLDISGIDQSKFNTYTQSVFRQPRSYGFNPRRNAHGNNRFHHDDNRGQRHGSWGHKKRW
ncbi:MAG: DEAD/DEAH box helicase [Candidatus Parvarchaeota archaeon]|nr:DEAD/DEAH box helicase [Candidatus Parvarchaeota archaeon]